MRTRLMVVVAVVGLLLATVPVRAHHAFAAEFDQNKPIKVQGTVTKWELTNPHSWIHIDVKGVEGKVVTWMIEGASPNNLYRLGLSKESLPAGSEIQVEATRRRTVPRVPSAETLPLPTARNSSSGCLKRRVRPSRPAFAGGYGGASPQVYGAPRLSRLERSGSPELRLVHQGPEWSWISTASHVITTRPTPHGVIRVRDRDGSILIRSDSHLYRIGAPR